MAALQFRAATDLRQAKRASALLVTSALVCVAWASRSFAVSNGAGRSTSVATGVARPPLVGATSSHAPRMMGRSAFALVATAVLTWRAAVRPAREATRRSAFGRKKEENSAYWKLLGLDPGATREEIKAAYADLAARTHPNNEEDPSRKEAAKKHLRLLQEAKNNLLRALLKPAPTIKYLFIGNPGVGKSTLLNSLAGDVLFQSGISIGQGMTYMLDRKQAALEGDIYMDTPGLFDANRRKQAAEAITKALKEGGHFKVIFVITLESGRLRPADKTTVQLVLNSAPIEHYGIIVNKVTPPVLQKLLAELPKLIAQFFGGTEQVTQHIIANPFEAELQDVDNVLGVMPRHVRKFIIEDVPTTCIPEGKAGNISIEEFERLERMFEERFDKLNKDNEAIKAALADKADLVGRLQATIEALRNKLDAAAKKSLDAAAKKSGSGCSIL